MGAVSLFFLGQHHKAILAYEQGLALPNGNTHIGLTKGLEAVRQALTTSSASGGSSSSSSSSTPVDSALHPSVTGHKRPRSPSSPSSSTIVGAATTTTTTAPFTSISSATATTPFSSTTTTDTDPATNSVSALDMFVADVAVIGTTVKKTHRAVDETQLGTSQQEVARLLQKNHKWINLNPFEVLALPHDLATEEDIKQRYRALCGLVHPDKCVLEGARQAFEYVSGAHKEIANAQRRGVIVSIIKSAHERAGQEIKKTYANMGNKSDVLRQKQLALEQKQMTLTRITFAQAEEARQRADKNQQAYRKREDDQNKEDKDKLKKDYKTEKEWNKGVDDRVNSWQSFAGVKKR